ncbi:YbaK/EbsC family protein [Oryzihumus sp.]|uniref:aminoacyl-tRNA deacylase n=1 Tax=Oryzihumus sp. TaxID=1968903 RepID=UPI002ED990FB
MSEERATAAIQATGIAHTVTRHGRVGSLAEAAAARGVQPGDIIKTLVVRRAEDDYLFVLVPGDREISWPKLRALLGVNRLSMPDAAVAREVTGYERGTITPFGSTRAWPVVADATVEGRTISLGAGAHGVAFTADGSDVIRVLDAQVADVTDPLASAP